MKTQLIKLFCLLFGHKMDYQLMNNSNIQGCFRCGDTRAFYYDGSNYWTDLEYYGLFIYPLWKIKNYIWAGIIWIKIKLGKLKVWNKNNEETDDVPF